MLKTYELRDIIVSDLNDFEASEKWEDFLMVDYETENDNIVHVNFTEIDSDGKLFENKYKITIEPVYD
ncbi:hypothetical protein [Sporosarcina sp. FSL W7-1283]|uniref:hypothetical protein n=1 Tax=Sporosarcina sp. FSL W7-1283 TaxID=2921560 RepID=UPI0030FADA8B